MVKPFKVDIVIPEDTTDSTDLEGDGETDKDKGKDFDSDKTLTEDVEELPKQLSLAGSINQQGSLTLTFSQKIEFPDWFTSSFETSRRLRSGNDYISRLLNFRVNKDSIW